LPLPSNLTCFFPPFRTWTSSSALLRPCFYLAVGNLDLTRFLSSVDPNQAQNRIPLQTELETLRNIRSEKWQLADITKRQLEQAKAAHERIQARHDNLLRELEAAQSELNVSHDYLMTLQQQVMVFQAEDDRLAGLLHPIRRCPEDVLRLIFECAVERPGAFKMATTLSHVCESWRAISLRTSSLWNNLIIHMEDDILDLELFMRRTKNRLKAAPVRLMEIASIREYPIEIFDAFMTALNLKEFSAIVTLNYFLDTTAALRLLPHLLSHFAFPPVDEIFIIVDAESQLLTTWDFTHLLGQLPSLKTVQLKGVGPITLGGTKTFGQIKDLYLEGASIPSLSHHLTRFLGLQLLTIRGKNFSMLPLVDDIVLPKLQELLIRNLTGFPWSRITAPRIWYVETDEVTGLDESIAFLCRHPSITSLHLDVWITETQFEVIAKSLVYLEHLSVEMSTARLYKPLNPDSPLMLLPKLKTLEIDDRQDFRLSLEDFESLVRSRLQLSHSQRRGDITIMESLKITVNTAEIDSLPWRKSSLLTRAQQDIEIWDHFKSMCTVELRWPN
jgi:hypothetical protein